MALGTPQGVLYFSEFSDYLRRMVVHDVNADICINQKHLPALHGVVESPADFVQK